MIHFNRHQLIKVLSLNSLSVGLQFLLGIASVKIVSLYLGAAGMAFLGNFRNFTAAFKSISVLGLREGLVKLFVEEKKESEREKVIATFTVFFLLLTLLLMAILLVFSRHFSRSLFQTDIYAHYIVYFALLLPFFVMQTVIMSILTAKQEFKRLVVAQIITTLLLTVVSIYLIYTKNIAGAFFSIVITDLLGFLVLVFFHQKKLFRLQFNFLYLKSISKFVIMAAVSAIIVPLTLIVIRNYIIAHSSISSAGIWEAVNRISGFYMMFFNAGLSMYYLPKLSMMTTDAQFKEELKYYFKYLIPSFIGVLVLVFLFKNVIISIALTPEFYQAKELLIWQLLGDLCRVMILAFGYQILVKTRVKQYIFIELFFNFMYFGLSVLLYQKIEVEGVVMAYFIANVLTLLIILFLFKELFKRKQHLEVL